MAARAFTFAAALAGLLPGASAWVSTEVSTTSSVGCATLSGSGGIPPTPIPTRGGDKTYTSSGFKGSTIIINSVTRVTAPAVTVTVRTSTVYSGDYVATVTEPEWTTWDVSNRVFATATWPSTECTNGVEPKTVTKYTGTYKPISGQATVSPKTYATAVTCSGGVTSFLTEHTYLTSGLVTQTTTPTSVVYDYTTTTTVVPIWFTTTVYEKTVTRSTTSYTVVSAVPVTRTACQPTYTTTYAAKCAPTNVIRAINGIGLTAGGYAPGVGVSYGPHGGDEYDPSSCCQLCEENEGCGALYIFAGSGTCGLLYRPGNATQEGGVCGEYVLDFYASKGVIPGQSMIYQSGCGLIEYAGVWGNK